MKNKFQTRILFTKKGRFLIQLMMFGILGIVNAYGETIVGKWKEQTDIEYFASGNSQPHPPFNGQFQVLEIKADQTFTSTEYMNWIPGVVAVSGVWSLTGDQLKTKTNNINMDYAMNVYTMKLESDMLILSLKQPAGHGPSMVEKRYKKI